MNRQAKRKAQKQMSKNRREQERLEKIRKGGSLALHHILSLTKSVWYVTKIAAVGLLWLSIYSIILFLYSVIGAENFYVVFRAYVLTDLSPFTFLSIYVFFCLALWWIHQDLTHVDTSRFNETQENLRIKISNEIQQMGKSHLKQVTYMLPIMASFLVLALDRSFSTVATV